MEELQNMDDVVERLNLLGFLTRGKSCDHPNTALHLYHPSVDVYVLISKRDLQDSITVASKVTKAVGIYMQTIRDI